MRIEKETANYWCRNCRRTVPNPKWHDVNANIISGHCPQCNEEVSRKLKAKG